MRVLCFFLAFISLAHAQNVITTVAGGPMIFRSEGAKATSVNLGHTYAVALDKTGNLYFYDDGFHQIFKISPDGSLSVAAGNGLVGFSGDGGQATAASLKFVNDLKVDAAGNLYLASFQDHRVREIRADGTIVTVAGNGVQGFSGDGGPATAASIDPGGIAVDKAGNLFIADYRNHRIRKVGADGIISTFAGNGKDYADGNGGPALQASFSWPTSLAFGSEGTLYIVDAIEAGIRKIDTAGVISQVPLSSGLRGSRVALDPSGNIYVSGSFDDVYKVTPDGTVTVVKRIQQYMPDLSSCAGDGPVDTVCFHFINGMDVDGLGNIYVADSYNNLIRSITNGTVTTVAGTLRAQGTGDGGAAAGAVLNCPSALTFDNSGNLLIADTCNFRVRRIASGGTIGTIAGNGNAVPAGDGGAATQAALQAKGLGMDGSGNLYILGGGVLRKVAPNGTISTLTTPPGASSLTVDRAGNIYLALLLGSPFVSGSQIVRLDTAGGTSAITGTNAIVCCLAVDGIGNLYFGQTLNGLSIIRKIDSSGIVRTLAGGADCGYRTLAGCQAPIVDGVPATSTYIRNPTAIAVSATGDLYIAEKGDPIGCLPCWVPGYENERVRMVDSAGIITTVAGIGGRGFSGDGGPATLARLNEPGGLAVDAAGTVYISDTVNNRIRMVPAAKPTLAVSPSNLTFAMPAGGPLPAPLQLNSSTSLPGLQFTAQASTDSGGNWLDLASASGALPGSISVSLNPAVAVALTQGVYTARVVIKSTLPNPAQDTVVIQLTVTPPAPPAIAVASAPLVFEAAGGQAPPAQTIFIANAGGGTLNWTAAASGGSWLSLSATTGTAGATSPFPLLVTATPGSLTPGVYSGAVTVTAGNPPIITTVPVTLLVSASSAALQLSQTGLQFTAVEGVSTGPSQCFAVMNASTFVFDVVTLSGGSWLQAAQVNSSACVQGWGNVSVSVNGAGLPAGQYAGFVRVRATANSVPQFLTVHVQVLAAGSLADVHVQPAGLVFASQAGANSPPSQIVRLATTAAASREAQAGTLTLEGGAWLDVLPRTAAVSAAQNATLTVQPALGSLGPGIYRGNLGLTAGGVRLRDVGVTYLVVPASCSPKRLVLADRSLGGGFNVSLGLPATVEVQLAHDCGAVVTDANVIATFSNDDPPLVLNNLRNGIYVGTWRPLKALNPTTIILRASHRSFPAAEIQVRGDITGSSTLPQLFPGGVVQGASYAPGAAVAPGSIVSLFGSLLAGPGSAALVPLPLTLGGATVNAGGVDSPLFFSSAGQINAQLPYELTAGTRVQAYVRNGTTLTGPETLTISAARPGIFTLSQSGSGQGAILNTKGSLVDSLSPASPSDVVSVYATGLGRTQPGVATGSPAPTTVLAPTVLPVQAQIAGRAARVLFAGLAPTFVGLYQVNVEIPAGIDPGTAVPLMLMQNGEASNVVTLAIKNPSASRD